MSLRRLAHATFTARAVGCQARCMGITVGISVEEINSGHYVNFHRKEIDDRSVEIEDRSEWRSRNDPWRSMIDPWRSRNDPWRSMIDPWRSIQGSVREIDGSVEIDDPIEERSKYCENSSRIYMEYYVRQKCGTIIGLTLSIFGPQCPILGL